MRKGLLTVILGLILCCSTCFTQTRTTPVEVGNTPNVTVTNTPNVSVTNTPNVNVANSPIVNVGNIPSVVVDNKPTVKIDPTANTVLTPTISSGVRLWSSNPTIANSTTGSSAQITCTGYREVKVAIKLLDTPSNPANLKIYIQYEGTPGGGSFSLGSVTFATPTDPIVKHGNFIQSPSVCSFVAPVLSDRMWFFISNTTGAPITIDSTRSWAWLVN